MARNPESDRKPQDEPSTGQDREEAQELGVPASPSAPASPEARTSKESARPKSPREFIQERMCELDKKGV
jgi:hypothetical protein